MATAYDINNAFDLGASKSALDRLDKAMAACGLDAKDVAKMVAARELLEACRVALRRMEHLLDDGTGEHSPAYLQVKAAIAKAEGA